MHAIASGAYDAATYYGRASGHPHTDAQWTRWLGFAIAWQYFAARANDRKSR